MFQIFGFLKFFRVKKKLTIFFFEKIELQKIRIGVGFLGYSFDVKFCGLSIYDVFRVIRALLRGFKSSLLFYNRTKSGPGTVWILGAQLG